MSVKKQRCLLQEKNKTDSPILNEGGSGSGGGGYATVSTIAIKSKLLRELWLLAFVTVLARNCVAMATLYMYGSEYSYVLGRTRLS